MSVVLIVLSVVVGVLMFNFFAHKNENLSLKQSANIEDRNSSNQGKDENSDIDDDPKSTDTNTEQYKIYLKAKINNEDWNGITQYPGSMFYPNGSTVLGVKSPYLVLIFGESRGKES